VAPTELLNFSTQLIQTAEPQYCVINFLSLTPFTYLSRQWSPRHVCSSLVPRYQEHLMASLRPAHALCRLCLNSNCVTCLSTLRICFFSIFRPVYLAQYPSSPNMLPVKSHSSFLQSSITLIAPNNENSLKNCFSAEELPILFTVKTRSKLKHFAKPVIILVDKKL